MRPVDESDIKRFQKDGKILATIDNFWNETYVSVSDVDLQNGSPKIGDMIARNPKNHKDQWLVAEQYFKDNFEDYEQSKRIR